MVRRESLRCPAAASPTSRSLSHPWQPCLIRFVLTGVLGTLLTHHFAAVARQNVFGSADSRHHGLALAQRQGRVHQREMAESLWEVPELTPQLRVVLLGEQSEIVAVASTLSKSLRASSLRPIIW